MRTFLSKAYERFVGWNPLLDRWIRYHDPKKYWCQRGGAGYFAEQEAVEDRTLRSRFIAEQLKQLDYTSLLEIGCGYGKQLVNFKKSPATRLVGIDFSRPQLVKAREYCGAATPFFFEADGDSLPFKDESFDVVLSSAVILHNAHEKARAMLAEMIRVSRKYLVHNEDTNVTFSRFGYDIKRTYDRMGFRVLVADEIPSAPNPSETQFVVVEVPEKKPLLRPEEIVLEYH